MEFSFTGEAARDRYCGDHFITHPHSRRGEQQDSPRAEYYAIQRS
jgi:hypothetical protein